MLTLFPYTTLFRSPASVLPRSKDWGSTASSARRYTSGQESPDVHLRADEAVDRKSTRLNSSHTVISYAVFCLKKQIKIGGSYGVSWFGIRITTYANSLYAFASL